MATTQRYTGTTKNVHKRYSWIDITSVRKVDGSPHDLGATEDIFIHRSDYANLFRVGSSDAELEFEVTADERRGGSTYRACKVTRVSNETRLARFANGGIIIDMQGVGTGRVLEHPSVFMSWCFTPALADAIKMRMAETGEVAQLLVIDWSGRYYESLNFSHRQLVNVDDPMVTVNFRRPGENHVVALVVFGQSKKKLRARYLSADNSVYCTTVLFSDELEIYDERSFLGSGRVEVHIPEELFAKKPRDWNWVNSQFDTPPRDQCAFRRRRIFAYTLLPIVFLVIGIGLGIWYVLRWLSSLIGIAVIGAFGMWSESSKEALCNPKDYWFGEMRMPGRSVFMPRIKGELVPFFLVFSPAFLGLVASGVMLKSPPVLFVAIVIAVVLVLLTVLTILSALLSTLHDKALAAQLQTQQQEAPKSVNLVAKEQQGKQTRLEILTQEFEPLTCLHADERTPDVTRLPLGIKTLRFYAAALKQKVCRGFAP